MTEQELLDIFIQERINMLIDIFQKSQPEESKMEEDRILQAEIFIENLPRQEKELVENYIDSLINQQVKGKYTLKRFKYPFNLKTVKKLKQKHSQTEGLTFINSEVFELLF